MDEISCTRKKHAAVTEAAPAQDKSEAEIVLPLSKTSVETQEYLHQPPETRKPVGYNREFLESYRTNIIAYLSVAESAHLKDVGSPNMAPQPAGTYARQILSRLLIDISWNSSRLEGNTYSLLDARRLIEFGEQPEGRAQVEAQMILNHKDAIGFLVGAADEIGFNRYTSIFTRYSQTTC